jgi:hypothetical protein
MESLYDRESRNPPSRQRYGNAIQGFCPILRSHNGRALNMDESTSVGAMRQREWRARRRANLRQRCGCCAAVFTPSRTDQAFCSSACRQKGYRRRKASGEKPLGRPATAPWRAAMPFRPTNPAKPREAAPRSILRDARGRIVDIRALIG